MKTTSKSVVTWVGIFTTGLILSACQQNATAPSANVSQTNSTNDTASAAPTAPQPPAAAAPDASMATGPLALSSDASLPARCQEVVREAQSCLDNMRGEPADRQFREQSLRRALDSDRRGWPAAQDDTYRTTICGADLATLRTQEAGYLNCRPH